MISGNRNFEGRVHANVRANYLASPPLVVAYALLGKMTVDITTEPLGIGTDGQPVYLRVIASSLSGNSAASGGGIDNYSGTNVVLTATIVAGSKSSGGDCAVPVGDAGYNLSDDNSCGFLASSGSQFDANPLLSPLHNNGGPTETMALQSGSPAIGAVNSATLCSTPDQRGANRPSPRCDIGAYQTGVLLPTITSSSPPKASRGRRSLYRGPTAGATAVLFNGTSATIKTTSATKITTTVPAGATTGDVQVTTGGGTATSTKVFTVT